MLRPQPQQFMMFGGLSRGGFWLRGVDLNHRPLGYEPNELPDCSTPQKNHISVVVVGQTQLTRSPIWGRQNSHGFPVSGLLHAAVFTRAMHSTDSASSSRTRPL